MMDERFAEFEKIAVDARKVFGNLSVEQLNWKPSAESWSIGQCFEHLIKSNELFFDEFDKIAAGTRKNSFYENYSPLSGFFGKFIVNALKKDKQKTRTIAAATPPSKIEADIIEKFDRHQAKLIEKSEAMKNADWDKTKLTSPFLKVATYSLADGLRISVEHEKRHFRQAERVVKNAGFPS